MKLEKFNRTALLTELKSCFNSKELEEIGRTSKFIRRSTSRLTSQAFLMMNVFDTTDGEERSLNDSCDWLAEEFGISMRKQSLDERYNTDAVRFIKTCFSRILQITNKGLLDREIQLPFSKIQLTDSTSFKIPQTLSTFYKGYKGKGGKSVMKIHLNYDFLNGAIEDIHLTDGIANDNNYKLGDKEQITPKALYIRDLGYYDLQHFSKLEENGAYFLSRGKTNCAYHVKDEKGKLKKIDIADFLPQSGQTKEVEDVYVGSSKNKVKVRLILQAVPQQVTEQRLKKLEQYALKHKDSEVSEQRKAMCSFNVFITNASAEMLPTSIVRIVYTIRWQIELVFKIWKSIFKIDKVKQMSIFRFECYIYSKLIAIVLTLHINNQLGRFLWDEYEFELSPMKAAKLIKKN